MSNAGLMGEERVHRFLHLVQPLPQVQNLDFQRGRGLHMGRGWVVLYHNLGHPLVCSRVFMLLVSHFSSPNQLVDQYSPVCGAAPSPSPSMSDRSMFILRDPDRRAS